MQSKLIVSDLHRVDNSGADEFKLENVEKFKKWVESKGADEIYFNGDIDDTDQAQQSTIDETYKEMNEWLKSINAKRIKGNHDPDARSFVHGDSVPALEYYVFVTDDGRRGIIIHAHQSDKRVENPFLKGLVGILGLVERLIKPLRKIDNIEQWSKKARKKARKKMDKYVRSLFKAGYRIVIIGHLHFEYIYEEIIDGVKHVCGNSGDCMDGDFHGIFVDHAGNLSIV